MKIRASHVYTKIGTKWPHTNKPNGNRRYARTPKSNNANGSSDYTETEVKAKTKRVHASVVTCGDGEVERSERESPCRRPLNKDVIRQVVGDDKVVVDDKLLGRDTSIMASVKGLRREDDLSVPIEVGSLVLKMCELLVSSILDLVFQSGSVRSRLPFLRD
ncbi:hypothetical protein VNO80_24976 [Phaseolus coccineus]|uniref:Uncharacterized protein n=1 Tax=Phaseolus coccineus TaxID=3886 RepID=A0AAN9QNC0_PHACN